MIGKMKMGLYIVQGDEVTPWLKVGDIERGRKLSDKSLHLVSAYTSQQALERKEEGTKVRYRVKGTLHNGSSYEEIFDTETLALKKLSVLKDIVSDIEVRAIIHE